MMNRERNSSTVSSDRVGRCAISTAVFLPEVDRHLTTSMSRAGSTSGSPVGCRPVGSLLGVVLHDQLFLDRELDLLADRELVDQDAHPVGEHGHPARNEPLAEGLARHDE